MIALERIAAILLCAGRSERFGRDDKLLQPLAGRPLVDHAAAIIDSLPFGQRLAVVPRAAPELCRLLDERGFTSIVNSAPEDGPERSLRLGIAAALAGLPDAFLVCLGDMPNISAAHLRALACKAGADVPAASLGEGWRSPPVLFPKSFVDALLERPAREVLGSAADVALVAAAPGMLDDFDTPGDFAKAAAPR